MVPGSGPRIVEQPMPCTLSFQRVRRISPQSPKWQKQAVCNFTVWGLGFWGLGCRGLGLKGLGFRV